MTPTGGEGSQPGGGRSAIELLPWWFVLGMVAASVLIATAVGGRMWILPVIVGAVGGGWLLLQDRMTRGRQPDERGFRWKVAGVARGIALVAAAGVGLLVVMATAISSAPIARHVANTPLVRSISGAPLLATAVPIAYRIQRSSRDRVTARCGS